MSNKPKRSTWLPTVLLAYLAVMAWVGRARLADGQYLYYFGVIGGSLLIIGLLRWSLLKKEAQQRRLEEQQYGTYADEDNNQAQ